VPGDDKNDALVRKRKSVREKEQLAMQQPKRGEPFFQRYCEILMFAYFSFFRLPPEQIFGPLTYIVISCFFFLAKFRLFFVLWFEGRISYCHCSRYLYATYTFLYD
jgi:hypothetical protein